MLKDIKEMILDFADNSQWLRRCCGIAIRTVFIVLGEDEEDLFRSCMGPLSLVEFYCRELNKMEMDWDISTSDLVEYLISATEKYHLYS